MTGPVEDVPGETWGGQDQSRREGWEEVENRDRMV